MEDNKQKMVEVTEEMIPKIKVLRLAEMPVHKGGFQRNLNNSRVGDIIIAVKRDQALMIPPISLGDTGDDLILIDGQHRFEARRRHKYQLFAQVAKMSKEEAVRNFIVMNGTSRRVSLQHRLKIDTSDFVVKCREMASRYGIPTNYVYHMTEGYVSTHSIRRSVIDDSIMTREGWDFINKVLMEWSQDKRFKNDAHVYSRPGVLSLITQMAKTKNDPIKFLRNLKEINYAVKSPMGSRYGTAGDRRREMKAYISEWLLENTDFAESKIKK